MNIIKKIWVLLLAVGELLIILGFQYWGNFLPRGIVTLDIIVASIIYSLFFIDLLFPMVDFNDASRKTIGSIGLRWFITTLYMVAAIGLMVIFSFFFQTDVVGQIIMQGILLFLFIAGLYTAYSSSANVKEVFFEEKQSMDRIAEIKRAMKEVQLAIEKKNDIPVDVADRINKLDENLRYISPGNNQQAIELETNFLRDIKTVQDCIIAFPFNYERVTESIKNCERLYKERKQIFSN